MLSFKSKSYVLQIFSLEMIYYTFFFLILEAGVLRKVSLIISSLKIIENSHRNKTEVTATFLGPLQAP